MATVSEAVRRLTIEATSRGVKEAAQDAKALAGGMNEVAVAAARQEKAVQSAESRLNSIQRRYDQNFRAQADLARVERDLQRAQDQGLISMQRRVELLSMAAERHGLASAAIARETAAVEQLTAANQRLGAANDNMWRRRNLTFQLFDVGQMLALGQNPGLTALQQGPQIAQLYAGQGGVNAALKETGSLLGGVVRAFPLLTGVTVAAGLGFAGLTYEINQSTEVAVGFGDVVMGAFEALADVIYEQLQPAINAISPWFASAWQAVIDGTKLVGNTIINSFRAAFEDLKTIFLQFPNIIAVGVAGAANMVVSGVEKMINFAVAGIDALIDKVNALPDWLKPEALEQIPNIGALKLGRVDAGNAGNDLSAALRDRNANIADIMNDDPLGSFYERVRSNSIQNALDGEKKKKSGGKTEAERLAERYKGIVRDANQATQAFQDQESALYMTEEAAAALTNQQDLLNKAEDAGIKLTAGQREELLGLGTAMAEAEASYKRAQENLQLAKDVTRGFLEDLRQGLLSGASFWDAFSNAALNALDKITDKLLDDVVDALFQVNNAGGGGGGGILGSIVGSIFGGGTSAYAPQIMSGARVGLFHNGGVVGDPGGMSRSVNPAMFAGAPRFHLGTDEVPAILQRGERVVPRGANQNGGTNIKFEVIDRRTNGGTVEQEQSTGPNGEIVLRAIVRDEMKKGMKPTLQAGFGITPKVSRRS